MIWPATPIGSRSARLIALSGTGQHVAVNLGREAAVVLEAGCDVGDVVFGLDDRLAAVSRLDLGELGGAGPHDLGELEQDAPAILGGGGLPRPIVERARAPRPRPGPTSARAGVGHAGDDLARGRIDDIEAGR